MYEVLNKFFLFFHSFFILFNLLGWIYKKTRFFNLISLLLTGFSWLIIGICYGIGYCPFTDWHWQILYKLGQANLPYSYMKYLLDTITGLDFNAKIVDFLTATLFTAALITSIIVNLKDRAKANKSF